MMLRLPVEDLLGLVLHVPGAMNWPFLTFTGLPVRRGLERGRSGGRGTPGSAGRRRPPPPARPRSRGRRSGPGCPISRFTSARISQALAHARAAVRAEARAVGLVVGGLEDEGKPSRGVTSFEPARHEWRVPLALDDAGPGEEDRGSSALPRGPSTRRPWSRGVLHAGRSQRLAGEARPLRELRGARVGARGSPARRRGRADGDRAAWT